MGARHVWTRGARYDLANHLLSFNIDRCWRARTVRRVREILARPDARVLDLCCGTGDLRVLCSGGRRRRPGDRFGLLPSHADGGATRKLRRGRCWSKRTRWHCRCGTRSLDLITVAFGFRNLANYEAGLREMRRVLRPGGVAAILEFSQPPNRCSRRCTSSTRGAFCR